MIFTHQLKLICTLLFLALFLVNCSQKGPVKKVSIEKNDDKEADVRQVQEDLDFIFSRAPLSYNDGLPITIKTFIESSNLFEKYGIAVIQDNEVYTVFSVFEIGIGVDEYLIFYHKVNKNITDSINLTELNPYYIPLALDWTEQQLVGFNFQKKNNDESKFSLFRERKFKQITSDYKSSVIHVGQEVVSSCSECPLVVKYEISLLPEEEVLEEIPYPGYTTFVVFDNLSRQKIGEVVDFPSIVSNFIASKDKEFLLATNSPLIGEFNDIYKKGVVSYHGTVLNYIKGGVCASFNSQSEFYVNIDRKFLTPIIGRYIGNEDLEKWEETILYKKRLFKRLYIVPNYERIIDGVLLMNNKGEVSKDEYEKDFEEEKMSCDEE